MVAYEVQPCDHAWPLWLVEVFSWMEYVDDLIADVGTSLFLDLMSGSFNGYNT